MNNTQAGRQAKCEGASENRPNQQSLSPPSSAAALACVSAVIRRGPVSSEEEAEREGGRSPPD